MQQKRSQGQTEMIRLAVITGAACGGQRCRPAAGQVEGTGLFCGTAVIEGQRAAGGGGDDISSQARKVDHCESVRKGKRTNPPLKLDINELRATDGKTDCGRQDFFFFFLAAPYVCVLSFGGRLVAASLPPLQLPAALEWSNMWSASGPLVRRRHQRASKVPPPHPRPPRSQSSSTMRKPLI